MFESWLLRSFDPRRSPVSLPGHAFQPLNAEAMLPEIPNQDAPRYELPWSEAGRAEAARRLRVPRTERTHIHAHADTLPVVGEFAFEQAISAYEDLISATCKESRP